MLLINYLFSITLDDKDKRILLIIFLGILLLLLFLGILNRLLHKYLEHSAKKIDPLVAGYIKYDLVLNEKELKKIGRKKAHVLFLKEATLPLLITIVIFCTFLIYCNICNVDWTYIFQVYDDIFLEFEAPTTVIFGMTVWADWPTIVEGSIVVHNNFEGYIAYALFISITTGSIWYLFASLRMNARIKKVDKKAKEIFVPSLDDTKKEVKTDNNDNKEK